MTAISKTRFVVVGGGGGISIEHGRGSYEGRPLRAIETLFFIHTDNDIGRTMRAHLNRVAGFNIKSIRNIVINLQNEILPTVVGVVAGVRPHLSSLSFRPSARIQRGTLSM